MESVAKLRNDADTIEVPGVDSALLKGSAGRPAETAAAECWAAAIQAWKIIDISSPSTVSGTHAFWQEPFSFNANPLASTAVES